MSPRCQRYTTHSITHGFDYLHVGLWLMHNGCCCFANAETRPCTYTTRDGDTFRSVALALGTNELLLQAVNPGIQALASGQEIALPGSVICTSKLLPFQLACLECCWSVAASQGLPTLPHHVLILLQPAHSC